MPAAGIADRRHGAEFDSFGNGDRIGLHPALLVRFREPVAELDLGISTKQGCALAGNAEFNGALNRTYRSDRCDAKCQAGKKHPETPDPAAQFPAGNTERRGQAHAEPGSWI